MNISTYRVRQNINFTDSVRHCNVSGTYIDILFESEQGKFLLPIFVLETNNLNAKDTYYSALGGLSQPRSRKNVIWHDEVIGSLPNAKKIILFSHEYSCLRETYAQSGKLLVKAIMQSDIQEIKPQGNIYCIGYSAGTGGIVDFISETHADEAFKLKYGSPKELILIDPVGLSPNPDLVIDFILIIFKSFLFRKKRGLNIRNAFTESIKEAKGTWMILGDKFVTIREILKDIVLGVGRHLKEEIGYFEFSKLQPIKAPIKLLKKGEFRKKAQNLKGNLKVKVISATQGLDPLTFNTINYFNSQRIIHSRDFLTDEEIKIVQDSLEIVYSQTVFENLNPKNIKVKIIESTHSMIFYTELADKVRDALLQK